jgi:hypothetical protein
MKTLLMKHLLSFLLLSFAFTYLSCEKKNDGSYLDLGLGKKCNAKIIYYASITIDNFKTWSSR